MLHVCVHTMKHVLLRLKDFVFIMDDFLLFFDGKKGTESLLQYMCVCGQSVMLSVRVRARIP